MRIAIIADDNKKELVAQLCIAYCGILCKHRLISTSITAKYIEEATGLEIEHLHPGSHGGMEQMETEITYDEIDMLIYIRDPQKRSSSDGFEVINNIFRMCDAHSVPFATNIATAQMLLLGLERGELDWRK